MQDSTRHWTLHAVVERPEDMAAQFERTIGVPVPTTRCSTSGQWKQNLLLADRYRAGRVFLAGDSAHLVIPTGGLGMNTGVGDAIDLSWKLQGTLQGWGGPSLLDSYEIERRQVGDRNVGASRYASHRPPQVARAVPARHPRATPAGAADARGLARRRQRRAAQDQRDDRRGARLSLRRISRSSWTSPAARASLPRVRADDLAAARGCRTSGSTIARRCTIGSATATRCCASGARAPTPPCLERAMRATGAPFSGVTIDDEAPRERLRPRPDPGPAGPARRLARQPTRTTPRRSRRSRWGADCRHST